MAKAKTEKTAKPKAERKPRGANAQHVDDVPQRTLPKYENAQVVEVLQENVNGKFHHCKMSDGTTKHIPIELFG